MLLSVVLSIIKEIVCQYTVNVFFIQKKLNFTHFGM